MNNENLIAIRTRGNSKAISGKRGVIDLRIPRRFAVSAKKLLLLKLLKNVSWLHDGRVSQSFAGKGVVLATAR